MAGKNAAVIGLGYVGLPVAVRAAEVGYKTVAIDVDDRKIASLLEGKSYVEDIDSNHVKGLVEEGKLLPTSDWAKLAGFEIAVISVPTPLEDGMPDLSFIESAASSLAPHVSKGCTVILESTTYPGTTDDLVASALEAGSGLKAGIDFKLGYSPERIDPGNPTFKLETTPKIVSGINKESLDAVSSFFADLVKEVVPVSGTKEAELAKLIENTFRHINIALVNELAMLCDGLGIDVWEAIDAAATKPFGFMKFLPGPGVGGHCLPIDPEYLSWQTKRTLGREFRFVELANDINNHMPLYVRDRIVALLNQKGKAVKGAKIVLLGVAYKGGTGDVRESPAIAVANALQEWNADLVAIDPYVPDRSWPTWLPKADVDRKNLMGADLVVLLTPHPQFTAEFVAGIEAPVLDTRNVIVGENIITL